MLKYFNFYMTILLINLYLCVVQIIIIIKIIGYIYEKINISTIEYVNIIFYSFSDLCNFIIFLKCIIKFFDVYNLINLFFYFFLNCIYLIIYKYTNK